MEELELRQIMQKLDQVISQGNKRLVIYPYGEIGQEVERTLEGGFGIKAEYLIDNKKFDGMRVLNMEQARKRDNEGICVLICSCREECYQEIRDAAGACFSKGQIIDMFPRQVQSNLLTEAEAALLGLPAEAEVLSLLNQIDNNLERMGIHGTDHKYSEV